MHHEKYPKFFDIHMQLKKRELICQIDKLKFHSFSPVYKAVHPMSLPFEISQNLSGKQNGLSVTFNSFNSSFMGCV